MVFQLVSNGFSTGYLMAFQLISIGFISGHLNSEAIDFIDVENVLGGVAEEEGAANEKKHSAEAENSEKNMWKYTRYNEKKHSAEAAQKRRNLIFVETTSFSAKEIFWSYLVRKQNLIPPEFPSTLLDRLFWLFGRLTFFWFSSNLRSQVLTFTQFSLTLCVFGR